MRRVCLSFDFYMVCFSCVCDGMFKSGVCVGGMLARCHPHGELLGVFYHCSSGINSCPLPQLLWLCKPCQSGVQHSCSKSIVCTHNVSIALFVGAITFEHYTNDIIGFSFES